MYKLNVTYQLILSIAKYERFNLGSQWFDLYALHCKVGSHYSPIICFSENENTSAPDVNDGNGCYIWEILD